ncbi:MAG: biotin/lipoyl-binding protein, partial [Chloroflexi bacterium]|nr:biotin/lipoyl-binding protein [Chloroflexota bacterium]
MAEVTMPRLSDTMTEGTIARWVKQPGEEVARGDILVEIETDKATMELEAYEAGVIEQVLVQEGQTVAIGQPIARIGSGNGQTTQAAPAEATEQAPAVGAVREPPTAQPSGEADGADQVGAATTGAVAPGDEGRAAEPTPGEGTVQPARAADV